jgi:hypothetical protein
MIVRHGGLRLGGEPLLNVPKGLAISFPQRRRPKMGVKQAAPENYRTRVLSIVRFGDYSSA